MEAAPYTLRLERPDDDPAIEALHDTAFGPGRFARAAYRLREGMPHEAALSFAGEVAGKLIGSIRSTRIAIGGRPALLLGPLAVDPAWMNRGCGKALVRRAVAAARDAGEGLMLLVGDEPYYGPLGFLRVPAGSIVMPGPVDPARVLIAELQPGAAEGLNGAATRAI